MVNKGLLLRTDNHFVRLLSFIGEGTFGQTFLARDVVNGAYFAVKILRSFPDFVEQGQREKAVLDWVNAMDEEDNYNLIHLAGYGLYRNHHVLVFPRYFCSLKEFMDNNSQGLSLRAIRSIAHSVSTVRRNHAVDSDIPVSAAQQRNHSHGCQTTQPFVRIPVLQGRFAGRDGAAHSQQPDSFNRFKFMQQRLSEALGDLPISVLAISGGGSPAPLRHEDRCLEFRRRPSRALPRLYRIPRSE